jgi:hypothetical protein
MLKETVLIIAPYPFPSTPIASAPQIAPAHPVC